jgi:hypothetical protein
MGANVQVVSTTEYWDIDGANATPLTLTWDAGSAIGTLTTSDLSKLTIAGWNGTQWVAIPSKFDTTSVLGGTSDLTAGSITTIAPLAPDTYTAYTFASLIVPLPVTLATFTALAENSTVLLSWSTTEETNSDRFEILRSTDGKKWAHIGTKASSGESKVLVNYDYIDRNPLAGVNLYRLKMIDKDQTYAYSSIRTVSLEAGSGLTPYPNPVVDKILIRDHQLVKQAELHNANGVKVFASQRPSSDGIDVTTLPQGIYIVTLTLFDGTISTHKVAVTR